MTLIDETVTAVDLSKVVIVSGVNKKKPDGLTSKDLEWQEQRSRRKIKELNCKITINKKIKDALFDRIFF